MVGFKKPGIVRVMMLSGPATDTYKDFAAVALKLVPPLAKESDSEKGEETDGQAAGASDGKTAEEQRAEDEQETFLSTLRVYI